MNVPILIVRTVSVETLSPVLDACAARWPGHPLIVVSSPGRSSELRTDPRVTEIIPYATGAEGFAAPIVCEHALEAVVVPVANRGGSGYANVMRACRALDTRTWWVASYARELLELSPAAWSRRWRVEAMLTRTSRVLAHAWGGWIRVTLKSRSEEL
jgi:hypothetical protein